MRRVALSIATLGLAAATLSGCNSSSSSATPTGQSPSGPEPTDSGSAIDRTDVDTALHHVLVGLKAISTPGSSAQGTVASLRTGSTELTDAAEGLSPAPTGVPASLATGVHTGLLNESDLMTEAADCLSRQIGAAHPDLATCAAPLRKADKATTALAHALISLSAYGSDSPTVFESDLVAALGGS